MQVNLDSLNCGICYCTIEDAVSCESCGNSFCSQCADDYEKTTKNLISDDISYNDVKTFIQDFTKDLF